MKEKIFTPADDFHQEAGKLILKKRKEKNWTQNQLAEAIDATVSTISRLEQGKGTKENYEAAMEILNISLKIVDVFTDPLKCAFTTSHWAAPIILLSQSEEYKDLSHNFKLSCTYENDFTQPTWGEVGEKLPRIERDNKILLTQKVKDLVKEGHCDLGFVASTLPTNDEREFKDEGLLRILSIVTVVRGGIRLSIIGKNADYSKDNLKAWLMMNKDDSKPINFHFYHANAQIEELIFDLNFSNKGYDAEIIEGESYESINESISQVLSREIQNQDCIVFIAGSFITGILHDILKEKKQNGEEYSSYDFNEYEWWGEEANVESLLSKIYFRTYDLIIKNDIATIERLYGNTTFKKFISLLKDNITKINLPTTLGTSDTLFRSHREVANFLTLDGTLISNYMQSVYYEMNFYPEWVLHNWRL